MRGALVLAALFLALGALVAGAVGEHYWDAASFYVNGSLVEWMEVHLYNTSLGYVIYYWSSKGVYRGVYYSEQLGPMYWFVVGPYEETIYYANLTTWRVYWKVYEAPGCWAEPTASILRYEDYIHFAVLESSDQDTINVDNTTLTHCYDIIVSVNMLGGNASAIVNATKLAEEGCPTCWWYTYSANATLSMNATVFTGPQFIIAYSLNKFAAVYTLPGWLIDTRLTIGARVASYEAVPDWRLPVEPTARLYCTGLEGNETTVYLVVRDWAAAELNATSPYISIWFNGTLFEWRAAPEPTIAALNATTIAFEWRVQVPPGTYTLSIDYTLRDRRGRVQSGTLTCLLVYKVLLRVPEYITTYEPRVEITGCAYDYYTMQPLPGLRLDLVLNGTRVASVATGADGCFKVVVELGNPGLYTLEYYWEGRRVARTVIDYVASGLPGIPGVPSIPVNLVPVPVSWGPSLVLPSPRLDTPTAVLTAFALAALWLWLAIRTTIGYATLTLGVVLALLGVVYGIHGLVAAGAIAMVAGVLLHRTARL